MERIIKQVKQRGSIAKELFEFLWEAKLWWMVPMIIVFLIFGLLIIFTESSAVAPFIYTLF